MTVAQLLSNPDFVRWLVENASPEELNTFGPVIKAEVERLKYDWKSRLRPNQLWPEGDWNVELKMAGRGFGKSLAGTVWAKQMALENPGCRIAVVAPTFADGRDTCIEGDSGLLRVCAPGDIKTWNRSLGEFIFANGSRVKIFSADEPERLRGPQFHYAYCDEMGSWRYPEAWDQLLFGLRLGEKPLVMVTTTPRPTKLIRDLIKREDVHVTRGSTFDNASNLAPAALEQLKRQYEGTRLGRQELYGELLTDVIGALWQYDNIDQHRASEAPDLVRISVNVDPSGGSGPSNDQQGIVVTGKGVDGHGYVLADRTCSLTPAGWGHRAVQAYREFSADVIFVEKNFGGDMAISTIEQAAKDMGEQVKIEAVTSSRGKVLRAEPVSALYEQCVAEGSRVLTEHGPLPIESVRVGTRVLTRKGYQRVTWQGKTGHREVVRITTDSGNCLQCTPDHKVYEVSRGFVRADSLDPKTDKLLTCHIDAEIAMGPLRKKIVGVEVAPHECDGKRGRLNDHFLSSMDGGSINTARATTGLAAMGAMSCCTGPSGALIMGPSLTGGTSTIGMASQGTMTLPTLRHLARGSTSAGYTECVNPLHLQYAQRCPHELASLGRDGNQECTYVSNAAGNMRLSRHVSGSARHAAIRSTGIINVEKSETVDVYDLTVENQHEFFADGVLVHNCRVHHVGAFPELETQMCEWTPDSGYSPDRVDALVFGLTGLILDTPTRRRSRFRQ